MDDEDRTLAVLLRQTEWLISDLAHNFPAGRVGVAKRNEAADILEGVAKVLRVDIPVVIDQPTEPEADNEL